MLESAFQEFPGVPHALCRHASTASYNCARKSVGTVKDNFLCCFKIYISDSIFLRKEVQNLSGILKNKTDLHIHNGFLKAHQ